jgi:peptide/nickel transport system permease protein
MRAYLTYLSKRLVQFVVVVFVGINITYLVTHMTPINPVEQSISAATSFGSTSPEAIEMMRQSLRQLYGLEGSPWEQYVTFWKRVLVGDFGPSLSAFPTPVSQLILRALPWTVGLLLVSTLLTWILGNLLGGLAGYYRNSRILRAFGVISMGLKPIPYYVVALVLLIIFGFLWPVLPISGGATMASDRSDTLPLRSTWRSTRSFRFCPSWPLASAGGSWVCARSYPTL